MRHYLAHLEPAATTVYSLFFVALAATTTMWALLFIPFAYATAAARGHLMFCATVRRWEPETR